MAKIIVLSKMNYNTPGGVEDTVKSHIKILEEIGIEYEFICAGNENDPRIFGQSISIVNIIKFFKSILLKNKMIYLHLPNPIHSFFIMFFCKLGLIEPKNIAIFFHSEIIDKGIIGVFFNKIERSLAICAKEIFISSERYAKSLNLNRNFKVLPFFTKIDEVVSKSVIGIPDKQYALYFGRIAPYKNINLLVELAEQSDFTVLLAGPVDPRMGHFNFGKCLLIDKVFNNSEKRFLIEKSELLCFPSISKSETFGIVQLEALTLGVPVINFNTTTGVPTVNNFGDGGACIEIGNDGRFLQTATELVNNNFKDSTEFKKFLSVFDEDRYNEAKRILAIVLNR